MPAQPVSLEVDSLPVDQMRQVNVLADRFEAELRSGAGPGVASFVSELDDSHARLVLLRLLMLTEQELEQNGSRGAGQDGSSAGEPVAASAAGRVTTASTCREAFRATRSKASWGVVGWESCTWPASAT